MSALAWILVVGLGAGLVGEGTNDPDLPPRAEVRLAPGVRVVAGCAPPGVAEAARGRLPARQPGGLTPPRARAYVPAPVDLVKDFP